MLLSSKFKAKGWGRGLLLPALLLTLMLRGSSAEAELNQAWSRSFAPGGDAIVQVRAIAWDSRAGELAVLVRSAPGGGIAPTYSIWRIDPAGERVGERAIPEPLRSRSLHSMVAEVGGMTLLAASDERLELAAVDPDGELRSRRILSSEIAGLDAVETLALADGTLVLAGELDGGAVATLRPGETSPALRRIATEGIGTVLDVAPARGGKVLALVHAREQADPRYTFAHGEIHVVLLERDGEVTQSARFEGRLGSLLDTGAGTVVLLDLGMDSVQEWWLLRLDDELKEIARLRVGEREPLTLPRPSQLLAWPGSGFVGVMAGDRGQPWVAHFSNQGALRSAHEVAMAPEEPGIAGLLAASGGDALYVVASTYEDDGREVRDVVRILKFVES